MRPHDEQHDGHELNIIVNKRQAQIEKMHDFNAKTVQNNGTQLFQIHTSCFLF